MRVKWCSETWPDWHCIPLIAACDSSSERSKWCFERCGKIKLKSFARVYWIFYFILFFNFVFLSFPVRSISSPFGIQSHESPVSGEKVRLHASVKVHVMRDHPLLRAERCASSLVFSQYVTSHLCGVSAVCNTRGGSRRASEWVSVECGTQYCMWTWTLACIYLKVCPLGTPGTRLRSRGAGGTDANSSWFWEMKEGHLTRRDEIGAEEISGSETWKFPCTSLLFTHTTPAAQALSRVACWQQHFILFFIFWQSTLALYTGHNHKLTLQKCSGTFRNISRGRPDKCEFQDFYHVVSLGESCASISSHSSVVAQQTS